MSASVIHGATALAQAESASGMSILQFVQAGGTIGYIIIMLSFVAVAMAVGGGGGCLAATRAVAVVSQAVSRSVMWSISFASGACTSR